MNDRTVSLPTPSVSGPLATPARAPSTREIATIAAGAAPVVDTINIDKSSDVHIGPKIVSVVQNIDNAEKVKDLPFHSYILSVIKNTTRAERTACAFVGLLVLGCIALIVYFTVFFNSHDDVANDPADWNITREQWYAREFETTTIDESFRPVRLVIINHSVSAECFTFVVCAAELRSMQGWWISYHKWDIPYNFIIGNDARIYEGCGWNKVGAHTLTYNRCSVGIGFIGDYRNVGNVQTQVTELQLSRALALIEYGVQRGFIHENYTVVGHRDLRDNSESPGYFLYNAIQQWDHYDPRYSGQDCEQIYGVP